MSWLRLTAWVGNLALALGVLILLFVAFELWGTSITTQLHQDALRQQFDHELAGGPKDGATPTTASELPTPNGALSPGASPAEGQPIGTIDIPEIGVNYVVIQGTSTTDLELGPGHYMNTPLPGQPGNAAIAGHRTTYLRPFYNLNELTPGDPIYITTTQGRFEYDVTSAQSVQPTDVAVLDPTSTPTLTLTTCTPRYSAAQRLVVVATLVTPPAPATTSNHPLDRNQSVPIASTGGLGVRTGWPWPAVGWGSAALGIATALFRLGRRRQRRSARLGMITAGFLLALLPLYFFFESITPLLPPSF